MIRRLTILLLIVGCVFATTNDRYKFIPYVSPGIQFGYTFNEGLFYGFQISLGFGIPLDDEHMVTPALSFGITQSFHNMKLKNKQELVKKYSDLQITYVTKYEFKRGVMECGMPGWQDCPVQPTFFPVPFENLIHTKIYTKILNLQNFQGHKMHIFHGINPIL